MTTDRLTRLLRLTVVSIASLAAVGCYEQQMANQARLDPLAASPLFANGMASRDPVPGTVARGYLKADDLLHTGMVDGAPSEVFPAPVTMSQLERGRERYEIFCTPCHDQTGGGNGIVVQRGFRRPASLHIERLRQSPPGYFFDVMTNGFGAMSKYASQVPAQDRWAIVAYIRALQLSQAATEADLDDADFEALGGRR